MLTKAVSMDMKVGTANRSGQREQGDGGFSDVLGTVKKDTGSRQGMSAQGSGVRGGKDLRQEFRFTEKSTSRPAEKISGEMRGQQEKSSTFDSAEPADVQAAEDLLRKAAELVTQTVRETGEKPDKAEAAEMLSQALETLKDSEDITELPEDVLIDAIMQVLAAISDGSAEGAAVAAAAADDMQISDIAPGTEEPVVVTTEPGQAELTVTADAESGAEFAAVLAEEMPEEPEYIEPEFDEGLKAFVGESVQKLADGKLSVEAAAADFEAVSAAAEPEEAPDMSSLTVTETVKMLADLIDEVKDELGISDISVRHVYGNGEETPTMAEGSQAELSNRMFRTDRTGELDHILNGTRADMVTEDGNKPETDTETYDAVHMAAELMGSRTETDIPVENEPMFPETAEVRPPEVQTAEQILDRIQSMQDDHTEFTMVLNPESLGRITVKIAAAGERISVEITADDPRTGAMLAARNEGLQSMLRDSGVQLEKCQIVSEHEDTQFNEQSYDGSSKNPYGRQDDDGKKQDDNDGESFYDLLQSI